MTPTGDRSLRKLPPQVKSFVLNDFPSKVALDSFIGEALHGPLSWVRSFHVSISGIPYRIAYEIVSKDHCIRIHYAGYRGGFYDRLRRVLGV